MCIVIGFRLQWANTKTTIGKSIYGLPFVMNYVKQMGNAAQHKNYGECHFQEPSFKHEMDKRIWCEKGQSSERPNTKKMKRTNLFLFFSTFNSFKWNEFIWINLHFVDLGKRKQKYFCIFVLKNFWCLFLSTSFCFSTNGEFLFVYCYLIFAYF